MWASLEFNLSCVIRVKGHSDYYHWKFHLKTGDVEPEQPAIPKCLSYRQFWAVPWGSDSEAVSRLDPHGNVDVNLFEITRRRDHGKQHQLWNQVAQGTIGYIGLFQFQSRPLQNCTSQVKRVWEIVAFMTECGGDDSRVPKGEGLSGPKFHSKQRRSTQL